MPKVINQPPPSKPVLNQNLGLDEKLKEKEQVIKSLQEKNQKIISRSVIGIFIFSILCLLLFCLSWKRKVGKSKKVH